MFKMICLTITLLATISHAQGLSEARLLNLSQSGRTLAFNLGQDDGIKEGDYGVVFKQIRSQESRDLRVVLVGKAKNLHASKKHSVWILFHLSDPELLIKGDKYQLLSESPMLQGRRPLQVGRLSVVGSAENMKTQAQSALDQDKDRLSKLKNQYEVITPTHQEKEKADTDAQLIDLEVWKENKNQRYRSSLYKSANKDEWSRQLRLATFEKMVAAYIQRVNDPDFSYEKFYEKQKKSEFAHEFLEDGNYQSEYNQFLRKESQKKSHDAKLFRSILEKGDSWSEDYSDEELATVLREVSILQEKDRRIKVLTRPTRYGVGVNYGFYLSDAQTDQDSLNKRDRRYATEVDFELTPFLGHENLERFTLSASLRMNKTAFEANSFNAHLDEYSTALGVNWYPFYPPYTYKAGVFFLGSYIRNGFAKAIVPSTNDKARYTIFSLPGFHAGFKYLMKNNFGIRLHLSVETLKLDRYGSRPSQSVLPNTSNLVESKLGGGLVYVF